MILIPTFGGASSAKSAKIDLPARTISVAGKTSTTIPLIKSMQNKGGFTLFQDAIKTRDKHTTYLAAVKEKARLAAIEAEKAKEALEASLSRSVGAIATRTQTVYQTPASPTAVQQLIIHWANVYGVSSSWMLSIASCESSFDPSNAYLGHLGLYQYLPETFAGYSANAGVSGSIWDADTQAHVTAWALANGHAGAWTCA